MPSKPPDPDEIHRRMLEHLEEHPPEALPVREEPPKAPSEALAKPAEPPRLMLRKLRLAMALERLEQFLRFQSQRGIREVIVIVGKGKNSAGGEPVLGPAVEAALRRSALVQSFGVAPLRLGGDGARLIRLHGEDPA